MPLSVLPPGFVPVKSSNTVPQGFKPTSVQAPPPGFTPLEPVEEDPIDMDWKEAVLEGLGNVPESAGETARGLFNAVIHPIDTAKGLGGLVVGGVQKLIPGTQEQEENFDLMIDFYKDRYGSVEGFKRASIKDPVGVLADGASFAMPGGALIKSLGTTAKVGALTKVGAALQKVSTAVDPLSVAAKVVRAPLGLVPKGTPGKMYAKAVKFSSSLPIEEAQKLVNTALAEKIMPTISGLNNLRSKINLANKEISDLIAVSKSSGQGVKLSSLVKNMEKIKEATVSARDIKTVNKVVDDFKARYVEPGIETDITVSVEKAQQIKQRIYKELEGAYAKNNLKPVNTETRMAIASNAREAIEQLVPEIKQLNAKDGSMIALRKALESRVATISKGEIINISNAARITAGGMLGGAVGVGAGITVGILQHPLVRAKLAIVLNDLKNANVVINPTQAAIRMGLVNVSRAEQQTRNK